MKKSVFGFCMILIAALFLYSCSKHNQFPEIPVISFEEFIQHKNTAGKDTSVDFVFTFKDGDGDLGYSDNEFFKCGIPQNNLFIFYEEKSGSSYMPKKFFEPNRYDFDNNCDTVWLPNDSVQLHFPSRMTYIQPSGTDKSIEGKVSFHFSLNNLLFLSHHGRFRFYINDRAGHQSNVEYSDELNINK